MIFSARSRQTVVVCIQTKPFILGWQVTYLCFLAWAMIFGQKNLIARLFLSALCQHFCIFASFRCTFTFAASPETMDSTHLVSQTLKAQEGSLSQNGWPTARSSTVVMPCWELWEPLLRRFLARQASFRKKLPWPGSKPVWSPQREHTTTGQTLTHFSSWKWHSWDLPSTGDSKTGQIQDQWAGNTSSDSRNTWEDPAIRLTLEDLYSTLWVLGKMRSQWRISSSRKWRMEDWQCWQSWVTLFKVLLQELGLTRTYWITWLILSTTMFWLASSFTERNFLFIAWNYIFQALSSPTLFYSTFPIVKLSMWKVNVTWRKWHVNC